MGAIWSSAKPLPAAVELSELQPAPALVGKKRRRVDDASALALVQTPAPAPVPAGTPAPASEPSIDPTPDGALHKYIVKCPGMYWATKKEVGKVVARIPAVRGTYGALHKVSKWDHFFITFPNEACAQNGLAHLHGFVHKGETWDISRMAEQPAKRMRVDDRREASAAARGAGGENQLGCPTAADVTAKWRGVEYEAQIERKRKLWMNALRLVTKNLQKEKGISGRLQWLDMLTGPETGRRSVTCCQLENIIAADDGVMGGRLYYRNKNEFTVGMSPSACGENHDYHVAQPTIGYALGLVRNGEVCVGEITDDCVTTGSAARAIAKCLTPVIRRSGLAPYDKCTHSGYWRQIMCRESIRTNQILVVMMVNPNGLAPLPLETPAQSSAQGRQRWTDEECRAAVRKALVQHFGNEQAFGLFWQSTDSMSALTSDIAADAVYGLEAIHERMCGLLFRVQPTAFFQVNTPMAEHMYNLIGDLAEITPEKSVLDVCCGTGTIGLSMARRAHSVVGIEMCVPAVEDAIHNAKLNGITNATFIAGKAEHHIHSAIQKLGGGRECVAVLDPPRAGLPVNVVCAVRAMRSVKRIIYVACEPNNFWRNALGFCRPASKAFRGDPFQPVKAVGVDLFPHTNHGELVIVLDRIETNSRWS